MLSGEKMLLSFPRSGDTAIKLRIFPFVLSLSKDEWLNPTSAK